MEQIEIYTDTGERLRTAEAVAELAGCKVTTLDSYLSRGQMPAPLGAVGRTRVWSSSVVESWLVLRGREQVEAVEASTQVMPDSGAQVQADLIAQIPKELQTLRRWTRHDHKRPIMTNGMPATITDQTTWTTFAKAKASTKGDGLGFVLDGDGIAGLDLNHCVVDGIPIPGAQAILDLLPDTYAELSPSGRGVRLFCRADVANARRFTSHGVAVQICGAGRFLTVTGNRLPGRPSAVADYNAAVRALLDNAHQSSPVSPEAATPNPQIAHEVGNRTPWGGGPRSKSSRRRP